MTQNQSYAAFIGLDKSDKKINVSLQQCAKNKMERSIVKGGAEALHAWVAALCARFPGQAVAICLEQPASGLIHALMSYDFVVLFPINPMTLARYREAFTPSRAKDDPTDADFLCELVALHREQLKAWQPDDVCTRKLRHLTQARRRSVNMRTRLSNQLKALLKTYFPQALELVRRRSDHAHGLRFAAKMALPSTAQESSPRDYPPFLLRPECPARRCDRKTPGSHRSGTAAY